MSERDQHLKAARSYMKQEPPNIRMAVERMLQAMGVTGVGSDTESPEELAALKAQLMAFGRYCVTYGDMTPMGARMLNRILDGES